MLPWVQGPRTLVMAVHFCLGDMTHFGFHGSKVREPWLCKPLWVHGMNTVDSSMGQGPRTLVKDFWRIVSVRSRDVQLSFQYFGRSGRSAQRQEPNCCRRIGPEQVVDLSQRA